MPLTCLLGRMNMENLITWWCRICIEHRHGLRLDTISYESKLYLMNNKCFLNFKYCWNYIKKEKSNTVGIKKKKKMWLNVVGIEGYGPQIDKKKENHSEALHPCLS